MFYQMIVLGSIVLVAFFCYSNSLHGSFIFDDITSIIHNDAIYDLGNLSRIWESGHLRFIANLSFALNYAIGRLDTTGYHLFNLVVHILTTVTVFWFVRLILKSPTLKSEKIASSLSLPLVVALIFLVHPIQTQAVTYITQRTASLAALFYIFTLALYAKSAYILQVSDKPINKNYKLLLVYGTSLITTLCALFTKENTFILPLTLLLFYFYFLRSTGKAKTLSLLVIPYFLITLSIYFWTFNIFGGGIKAIGNLSSGVTHLQVSRLSYTLTQFNVVRTYIRLLVLPINQNLDYDFPISHSFDLPIILSLLLIISLIITALFLVKKNRLVSFGILFFFLNLLIESFIIPLEDVIFEHRLYIPSVGFFLAASALFYSLLYYIESKLKISYLFAVFTILTIISLSFATRARNEVWQSSLTLWSDVVQKSPNKERAHFGLGMAYLEHGKTKDAEKEFLRAIELNPLFLPPYNNLAILYHGQGKIDLAVNSYQRGLAWDSRSTLLRNALGVLLAKQEKYGEAIAEFEKVLEQDAKNAQAFNNMGVVWVHQRKLDKAQQAFDQALAIDPNYEKARQNSELLKKNGYGVSYQ